MDAADWSSVELYEQLVQFRHSVASVYYSGVNLSFTFLGLVPFVGRARRPSFFRRIFVHQLSPEGGVCGMCTSAFGPKAVIRLRTTKSLGNYDRNEAINYMLLLKKSPLGTA